MTAKHLSARVSLSFGHILNIIVVLLYRDILDYAPMILAMFFIISLLKKGQQKFLSLFAEIMCISVLELRMFKHSSGCLLQIV
jgi:hypothetical protein